MNKFVKKLIDKNNKKFKEEFARQKKFFSKPDVLIALGVTAVIFLDKLLKGSPTKKEVEDFVRTNVDAKKILKYTSLDIADDNLNDLLCLCANGATSLDIQIPDINLEGDVLDFIDKNLNDIDIKINESKLNKFSATLGKTSEMALVYGMLGFFIVMIIKDLLTKTEYPSKYRTKYAQRLLRNVYGLIKIELKSFKNAVPNLSEERTASKNISKQEFAKTKKQSTKQLESMLGWLKKLDNILIAVTLLTTIYINNRKHLQKASKQTLDETAADVVCSGSPEAFDVSVNKIPFQVNLNCPVIIDDVLVPHVPIELKLQELSCEINQDQENVNDSSPAPDLVTHAIIQNKSSKTFTSLTTMDAYLTQDKVIATFDKKALYSPVDGYVVENKKDEIVLRDISGLEDDYLSKQITLLTEKTERLNYVKSFIKDFYVLSSYPALLAVSTLDDASTKSTTNQYVGVSGVYAFARQEHAQVINIFERNVKNITGQDNVEKNAKNETLYKIKDQLEEQEIFFYKREEAIGASAENAVLRTLAKPEEFILFEYYSIGLGEPLNSLANPSGIEIQFRDLINEFIRRRYVLEGYKKKNLEDKIDAKIKEIEKGISVGNWFKKAMDVYKPSKKLDDVRKWLTGLADKNNKLNPTERTMMVNSVMFLFEFYLNADALAEKYNIIKKETTPQKETVKEGTNILNFFKSLWKEFNTLPTEINNIQALIDSLSSLQTYSITEWQGYQARLYTLVDEPKCSSKETDPYLNPKSKYGYGDIQYWFKYCAFATLASCANPATGWSTGWIFPTPILFPVVYIPIKSIMTKYGFIVIGITICGIWIFPWTLFVNMTTNHNTVLFDPTLLLKKEIEALKKSISNGIRSLKKDTVKKMMAATKIKIDEKEVEIKSIKTEQDENKRTKPHKTVKSEKLDAKTRVQNNVHYVEEFTKWQENSAALQEKLIKAKTEKFALTKKYSILNSAYKSGGSVKGADPAIEQTEKNLNAQLDKLSAMTDKVDLTLAPLPITMKPDSANFGITIKNTKPVIKIADELDDNVNEGPLNKIFDKFKLKNDRMASSTYKSTLPTTMINYKAYKKTLSAGMMTIVKKDPFPSYELLKPVNVPWLAFLYKDFVTTGAKSYGFPGQMPFPI